MGLFSDMIIVSWAYHHDDEASATKAEQAAKQLGEELNRLIQNTGIPADTTARYILHAGTLNTEKPIANQWRGLFAQAIIKLDILEN
jgi:hypothetical protein